MTTTTHEPAAPDVLAEADTPLLRDLETIAMYLSRLVDAGYVIAVLLAAVLAAVVLHIRF